MNQLRSPDLKACGQLRDNTLLYRNLQAWGRHNLTVASLSFRAVKPTLPSFAGQQRARQYQRVK